MSIMEHVNYTIRMTRTGSDACDAWQLLVRFFFSQRANLPTLAAELQLSPAQCHLLRAIEPGQPIPMRHAADTLACDASNVTGLVDRLESRGLIRRRPSDADRRVTMLDLTPTGSRLRALLLDRMSAPPAALGRLSVQDQRALVRILTRLLE
jgi:DNA-binding MarR family transcriptional regulator